MCHTTADLPELPPSTAHEDIGRALADMEAKLSAWAAAVTDAHATLAGMSPAERASECPESPTDGGHRDGQIVPSSTPAEDRESVPPVAAAQAVDLGVPPASEPAASGPKVHEAKPVEARPGKPHAKTPEVHEAKAVEARPGKPHPKAREAPLSPWPSAPDPEDEALLASLDPETAKAIRIHRRLSLERKSVRQLLEEIKHTRSSREPADPRKKSWWSRG